MIKDPNIGFIGLGNVGLKLANSILLSKYNLYIYDKDKKKGINLISNGANWCKDVEEIAKNSSI